MTTQPADTIAAISLDAEFEAYWEAKWKGGVLPTNGFARSAYIHAAKSRDARYDEACGIIRGLVDVIGTLWHGWHGEHSAIAAAQAFLSGTPTDGAQGGEES